MPSPAARTSSNSAEAHGVAKQIAHGAARIGERRLGGAVARKPGAMHAGDVAREIGDGGDQGRPGFERSIVVGAVVAGGMEAQRRKAQAAP